MGTIVEKLTNINNSVNDIQNAINEKGIAISNDVPLSLYANKIREIKALEAPANIEFDVSIPNNNTTFRIPSSGWIAGSKIVWGDGNITQNPSNNPNHLYSKIGMYHVAIYGHTDIICDIGQYYDDDKRNNRMMTGELKLNPISNFSKFKLAYTNIIKLSGNIAMTYNYMLQDADGLGEIELKEVTNLAKYAFGTTASNVVINLRKVVLPKVVTVGEYCFFGSSNLSSLWLPETVSLETEAFGKLSNANTIVLPKATNIGDYCFDRCGALTTLKFGADTAITFGGNNVFYGVTTGIIDLFLGTYEYSQANLATKTWKNKIWKSINQYL